MNPPPRLLRGMHSSSVRVTPDWGVVSVEQEPNGVKSCRVQVREWQYTSENKGKYLLKENVTHTTVYMVTWPGPTRDWKIHSAYISFFLAWYRPLVRKSDSYTQCFEEHGCIVYDLISKCGLPDIILKLLSNRHNTWLHQSDFQSVLTKRTYQGSFCTFFSTQIICLANIFGCVYDLANWFRCL